LNETPVFSGGVSRSLKVLPKDFEMKILIKEFDNKNLQLGITDNGNFGEDSTLLIDNVWVLKPATGEIYSSNGETMPYLTKKAEEFDSVIITKCGNELSFCINFEFEEKVAFTLEDVEKDYYLYCENHNATEVSKVVIIYIRNLTLN